MIERSFDAARINALVNDPTIRPYIGGDITQPLDLTGAVVDRNVFLLGEHGGFAVTWCAPGIYEVHTFILPGGRGLWAIRAARKGFAIMRDEYGAERIWTRVEETQANVRAFTLAVGFKPVGAMPFDLGAGNKMYQLYEWRA